MITSIWITDNCNMNCDYCYVGEKSGKNMPISYISNIIYFINKQQAESGNSILYIKFFGGEPLINYEFIKEFVAAVECQQYNFPVKYSITTNGTLLNEEIISFMIEKNMSCSVSIDGIPKIHNRHRKMKDGQGSWEFIKEKTEYIRRQRNLELTARMTYTSETAEYLSDSVKFLAETGFRNIQAVPDYFDKSWTDENFGKMASEYASVKEYAKRRPDLHISIGMREENAKKGCGSCGGGRSTFSINVDGDIFPCTYAVAFPELKIGDIFHTDAYKMPDYTVRREDRKVCDGCKYFQLCMSGRCIFLNYKITGNYYIPGDFFCEYQKMEYKYLGL